MKHPALALAWHSWRLSRRWFLLLLFANLGLGLTLLTAVPARLSQRLPEDLYVSMVANNAFVLTFMLGAISGLMAITLGSRQGFPFTREYRLPVSSALLTLVPLFVVSGLCSALYVLPASLYRLLYGLHYPILPAVVLISSCVFILLGVSWSAKNDNIRNVAILMSVVPITMLHAWIDPFDWERLAPVPGAVEPFDPRVLSLSPGDYLSVAGVMTLVAVMLVQAVSLLRSGGETQGTPVLPETRHSNKTIRSWPALADRISRLCSLPCPTRAPWAAECWLELQRHALPTLLLALRMALFVPLLYLVGRILARPGWLELAAILPLLLYFAGIGIALLNRRQAHGGYMNVFEAARPCTTLQLAAIQILMTALAITLGMACIELSLQLSAPLAEGMPEARLRLGSLISPLPEAGLAVAAMNQLMELLLFLSVIALFSCLHSCSVFWGRRVLVAVVLVLLYCLVLAARIRTGQAELASIIRHMWAFSGVVLLLTLWLLYRIRRLSIVGTKGLLVLLTGGLVAIGCSSVALKAQGYDLALMAPEARALTLALLTLPLTMAALTLWCYDRLRHGR